MCSLGGVGDDEVTKTCLALCRFGVFVKFYILTKMVRSPPPKMMAFLGFFSARLLCGFCVLSLQNLCIPLQLFLNPALQKLHLRCLAGLGQDEKRTTLRPDAGCGSGPEESDRPEPTAGQNLIFDLV